MAAKKKFYAVRAGRNTGVFEDWTTAEKQVAKFKGAIFQSFDNPKTAWDFVRCTPKEFQKRFGAKTTVVSPLKKIDKTNSAIAYTDGSYEPKDKTYSYGAVILWKNKIIKISQRFDDEINSELRNVAGELMGAMRAIKFAYKNEIKHLTLYHDYQGIAAWAKGTWKANLEFTKHYRDYVQDLADKLTIDFVWVKGHSGDYYNEMVDYLAKTAIFIESRKVEDDA